METAKLLPTPTQLDAVQMRLFEDIEHGNANYFVQGQLYVALSSILKK